MSDVIHLLVVLEVWPLLVARVFTVVAVSVKAAGSRLTGRRWAERRLRHLGKLEEERGKN